MEEVLRSLRAKTCELLGPTWILKCRSTSTPTPQALCPFLKNYKKHLGTRHPTSSCVWLFKIDSSTSATLLAIKSVILRPLVRSDLSCAQGPQLESHGTSYQALGFWGGEGERCWNTCSLRFWAGVLSGSLSDEYLARASFQFASIPRPKACAKQMLRTRNARAARSHAGLTWARPWAKAVQTVQAVQAAKSA